MDLMEKKISSDQWMRLKEAFEQFVCSLDLSMKTPSRKKLRANRTANKMRGKAMRLPCNPSVSYLYDTKENRWVCFLLSSLQAHLSDLAEQYPMDSEATEILSSINSMLSKAASHPCLPREMERSRVSEQVSEFPEKYRKLYHSYVILKSLLAEIESEVEIGLSLVNWEERDVLVGSFGSEEQFRHNLAKKYYYAPESHFDPTCFPIRYVALYQSAHFEESGICYYGEVKAIRRLKRKKIRFGVRKRNGEEFYYLFRVKEWKRLSSPIQIQDEGVFAPKYTNLFLLMRSRKTYELFHLRSEREYRIYHQLFRWLAYASDCLGEKEYYPIEDGKYLWIHDGRFDILNENQRMMMSISVLEFLQHPTQYLDEIFACIERREAPSELPLWVIRENKEYEEKYGVPYQEE